MDLLLPKKEKIDLYHAQVLLAIFYIIRVHAFGHYFNLILYKAGAKVGIRIIYRNICKTHLTTTVPNSALLSHTYLSQLDILCSFDLAHI